ncbi:hypothetical protein [Chromobacterium sp. IIBBL 290-4]|nr:hypothetical protein [Chromobacterium sp. IIBBL 290-4]
MIFSGNENWLAWLLGLTALQAKPKLEWLDLGRNVRKIGASPRR